jgi:uncharacterized membrane protein
VPAKASRGPEHSAEFKRRLEAFSDIVFGLSLSQLAVLLTVPDKAGDLFAQPLRYVIFFASFAIVCGFWYSHHTMFRYFQPGRIDVLLNFGYLAFSVLVPFGMRAMLQFPNSPYSFALYVACFTGTSGTMGALVLRALRRYGATLPPEEALRMFRRTIRLAAISIVFLVALALLPQGLGYAGSVMWLLFPLVILPRFVQSVPRWLLAAEPPA